MDKLSEYIPILIILFSVIITALGKKKKPEKITQKTTLPGQTAEEFIEEYELPRTPTAPPRKTVVEKPKKPASHKPEKEITSFSSETQIHLEPDPEGNSPVSFEDEDDVMKAIIYSEIINKKEW